MQGRTTPSALRAWLAAALSAAVTGILIAGAAQLGAVGRILSTLGSAVGILVPLAVCLLLLAALKYGLAAWRLLDRLSRKPIEQVDVFLLALWLVLVYRPVWMPPLLGVAELNSVPLTNVLGWLVGGVELVRWIRTGWYGMVGLPRGPQPTSAGLLLDQVVGEAGFEALPSLDVDDALDRGPFVETLEAVVRHPRNQSLTFGLQGPWGSGKTTILNSLEKRLRENGVVVVRFDAWSFREPERVVGNYLEQLGATLRSAGGAPRLRTSLRRLGLGIAPLARGSIGDAVRNWLSTSLFDPVHETLDDLRAALRDLRELVVVIVDDLDRLDRGELDAALRAVYLLADLPHLVHVLAYDRSHAARVLFPEDRSGQLARDYLAKVIDVELSLSTPTPEAAARVLGETLQPLLGSVADADAKGFIDRLNALPRQVFIEAMPTPREVRRVCAATALLWPRLHRDVNLFDLFILQVIHARFPRVFATLHLHPEWFTQQQWSGDLWRIAEGERWDQEAKAFLKELSTSQEPDDVRAARLLALIFPRMVSGGGYTKLGEPEARRERRICHPEIFPRYFQLSVPRETVSESSVEDLATRVKAGAAGVRAAMVQNEVEEAAKNGRARAFLEQWDIFLGKLKAGDQPLSYDLVRDIAVGVARATPFITGEYNDPFNPRRLVAPRLAQLVNCLDTPREISALLCEVIRTCPSFAVSGELVSLATAPEPGDRAFPQHSLDEKTIRGEFDQQVRARLSVSPSPLFDLPNDDIAAVLVYTEAGSTVREVFTRAIFEHKDQLPRILRFALTLDVKRANVADSRALQDELTWLHGRLDLADLHRQTEALPVDYWEKLYDRALVYYFRTHHEAAVAKATQPRPTLPAAKAPGEVPAASE